MNCTNAGKQAVSPRFLHSMGFTVAKVKLRRKDIHHANGQILSTTSLRAFVFADLETEILIDMVVVLFAKAPNVLLPPRFQNRGMTPFMPRWRSHPCTF